MEGGVVHDYQGAGAEFPQELLLEVLVKDGRVQAPLKKDWGEEPSSLGRGLDEVGPRPASPAALSNDLATPGVPCGRAVGGSLEPGLVKINRAAGTLLQAFSQDREVLDPACRVPFCVAACFFSGRPHPPEGVPDGADAHLEVGRPFPLEGVGILRDVPLEGLAVQFGRVPP